MAVVNSERFSNMTYRDISALAISYRIPGNLKKTTLLDAITAFEEGRVDDMNEILKQSRLERQARKKSTEGPFPQKRAHSLPNTNRPLKKSTVMVQERKNIQGPATVITVVKQEQTTSCMEYKLPLQPRGSALPTLNCTYPGLTQKAAKKLLPSSAARNEPVYYQLDNAVPYPSYAELQDEYARTLERYMRNTLLDASTQTPPQFFGSRYSGSGCCNCGGPALCAYLNHNPSATSFSSSASAAASYNRSALLPDIYTPNPAYSGFYQQSSAMQGYSSTLDSYNTANNHITRGSHLGYSGGSSSYLENSRSELSSYLLSNFDFNLSTLPESAAPIENESFDPGSLLYSQNTTELTTADKLSTLDHVVQNCPPGVLPDVPLISHAAEVSSTRNTDARSELASEHYTSSTVSTSSQFEEDY